MDKLGLENWKTNIENLADEVAAIHGCATVVFVCSKYGATDIENLLPSCYGEVFSELLQYSCDF